MSTKAILPCAYFGNVHYFSKFFLYENIVIEQHENFKKQTYRSRCEVCGANGKLDLIVPLSGRRDKVPVNEIRIDNSKNWQNTHWRSIQSAYRRSPYFEFYEQEFAAFYEKPFGLLIDLDRQATDLITGLLTSPASVSYTSVYQKQYEDADDFRESMSPRKSANDLRIVHYRQVFEDRHGFLPNMSMLDLLFNTGKNSVEFLRQ